MTRSSFCRSTGFWMAYKKMLTVTWRTTFEAAHRLAGYEGKCSRLHGHSYKVELTYTGEVNPATGMLVDFDVIRRSIGAWIASSLDHHLLAGPSDPPTPDCFWFTAPPTVETIAETIFNQAVTMEASTPLEASGNWGYPYVRVQSVRVWETENCSATVTA